MTSIYKCLRSATSLTAGLIVLAASTAALADVPTDIVPRNSGAYDALAVLAEGHLLPPGDDAETFLGTTARLRTRGEIWAMVQTLNDNDDASAMTASETAAYDFLTAYVADPGVADHTPHWGKSVGFGADAMGEAGGQKDQDSSKTKGFADAFGNLRAYGTSGSLFYTAGVSNFYQQRADYLSFNTRAAGLTADDDVAQRDGLQEAYVAWQGSHGVKIDLGMKDRRWGPGYSGDMLLSDNAPAHPGMEIDAPLWLGHTLKLFRFTQIQESYDNVGKSIYVGVRRLDHPLDQRLDLDLQESYAADKLTNPTILFLPYYLYQHLFINKNTSEGNEFNYTAAAGLTYKTGGAADGGDVYFQFLVDDIEAPGGLGLGDKVPRKTGYIAGVNQTFKQTGTSIVAEYIHTDQQTYTKTEVDRAPLSWFANDLPLGSPIGPDGQEIYGRLGQRLSDRLDLTVAGTVRRRVDNSFPAPNDTLLTAALAYHLTSSRSVALRYADFREESYNGTVTIPDASGGADYGVNEHQKVLAVDYLIGF